MKTNLIYKFYPKKTVLRVKNKIKMLGDNTEINEVNFLVLRLVFTLVIFGVVLLGTKNGYIWAPLGAGAFYVLMEQLGLDLAIKKRAEKLEKETLFFLEVLVLTLEGGRSLKHALSLTASNIDSEIAREFKQTLSEVNLGKSLNEALNDMKKRIPSDNINNVILNMVQSNTYGNSIVEVMYNQIEFLRNKRILEVKADIAKLPMKISVISVIFFIPIMLLVILAPVIINLINR